MSFNNFILSMKTLAVAAFAMTALVLALTMFITVFVDKVESSKTLQKISYKLIKKI